MEPLPRHTPGSRVHPWPTATRARSKVFAAAGLAIDDDHKVLIARQAQRGRFSFPTEGDRTRREAVRAAATFLDKHSTLLEESGVQANTTQLAVLAIELHDAFLRHDDKTGTTTVVDPDPQVIRVKLTSKT